jgi:adhesin transport system outer membrane protein
MVGTCLRYIGLLCLCCTVLAGGVAHGADTADGGPAVRGETGLQGPAGETKTEELLRVGLQEDTYTSADRIDAFNATMGQDVEAKSDGNLLTLYRACELAIQNHPLVESSRSSKLESEADYGVARSVYMPRIDLQSQLGPSHYLDDGTTTYGESALSVTQTIFNFGGLQDGVDSAELKAVGAKLRYARTQEDIAALVINSYFTILQAQELVTVYENSLEFYRKLLDTFWERYNAGISSKADAQKVEVSMKSAESQLTIQNQQLKTARNLLENIIKQPVDKVDPNIDVMKINVEGDMEDAFAKALDNNVSLRAYEAEIQAQEKVIDSRSSEYLPSFGYRLQAKNEFQKVDGYRSSVDAQITMNWNLFSGMATQEKINKEKAVLRRMVATKDATELDIRNVLSDAFNAYRSSEKEFQLAKEAYDSSVYLMGLYLSEFDLGIRTLLDLIQAREGQTNAAFREVNARYARIRSILNIILEEGTLPDVLDLPIEDLSDNSDLGKGK